MNVNFNSSLSASLAGSILPQTKGTETDRAVRESADKARELKSVQRAEVASDVGETDDDVETTDRDADGRQLLERRTKQPSAEVVAVETNETANSNLPHVKDPTGEIGNAIDLDG